MLINKISFYQLDNLVVNRVPFMFYNMGPSIKSWYENVSRLHLETYEKLLPHNEVTADLIQNKIPLNYAIVLVCENGQNSSQLADHLAAMSYTNVYVVDGGYQQMVTDRQQI